MCKAQAILVVAEWIKTSQKIKHYLECFSNLALLVIILPISISCSQESEERQQYATEVTPNGQHAAKVIPVGQTGNWTMLFEDEFNGTSLNTSKWTTCYFNFKVGNGCDHNQNELELYQPDNVIVKDGVLTLRAEKRTIKAVNGKAYNYTSGMISTGPTNASTPAHFAFTYGYMEMRAKVPYGKGLWPAFWTLPADLSWPPEIDVFEILGDATNRILMHYHYAPAGDSPATWTGPDFSADWHTYAVDWEPDAITWYVDGIERRRYTDTANIASKPMFLVASLAVGGDFPGSPDSTTHFPSYYQIDYIRVWKRASSSSP